MGKSAFLIYLFSSVSFAAVVMIPEINPSPDVSLVIGETLNIDFWTQTDTPFYGAVELEGVGELQPLVYYFPPEMIPPPEPPAFEYPLPSGMLPVIFEDFQPYVVPMPYLFETVVYAASEAGDATIYFYKFRSVTLETVVIGGQTIQYLTWDWENLDSFDITVDVPEPMTAILLAAGCLFLRRR